MKNGPYILIIPPNDYPGKRYRGRYAYEHHVTWWKTNKLPVPKGYEIHHINGNHHDNRIENLSLLTSTEHRKVHGKIRTEKSLQIKECDFCGKKFKRRGSNLRSQIKRNKNGKCFCSISCGRRSFLAL